MMDRKRRRQAKAAFEQMRKRGINPSSPEGSRYLKGRGFEIPKKDPIKEQLRKDMLPEVVNEEEVADGQG